MPTDSDATAAAGPVAALPPGEAVVWQESGSEQEQGAPLGALLGGPLSEGRKSAEDHGEATPPALGRGSFPPIVMSDLDTLFQDVAGTKYGVVLSEDDEAMVNLLDEPRKKLWLYAFCRTGSLAGAERLLVDPGTQKPIATSGSHRSWLKTDEQYAKCYEHIAALVDAIWEGTLLDRAFNGVEEQEFDVDKKSGALILRRVRKRQDPNLLRMVVGARIPEYRSERGGAHHNVTIVVTRTDE